MASKKVWVLTSEVNEYNQEGEYFIAVFLAKPSHKTVAEALSRESILVPNNIPEFFVLLEHILEGGGRRKDERVWFHLRHVEAL